jgi:hypothetical protein
MPWHEGGGGLRCRLADALEQVGVGVSGDRDRAVAQDLAHHSDVYACGQQEGRPAVPQIAQPDPAHTGLAAQLSKPLGHLIRP